MREIAYKIFKFFASLRLTVVTLSLSLILVFAGTIAQVKLGLYTAQQEYFSSLFIYWGPQGASWKIPVFPGGYLLGALLLVNLVAAHFDRWSPTKKKIGISIIHAGLVVMFLGQFATQLLQVESYMLIPEGGSANYSSSDRRYELAVINVDDPKTDRIVSFPDTLLMRRAKDGSSLTHDDLKSIQIRVRDYFENSDPRMVDGKVKFEKAAKTTAMDQRDIPAGTFEVWRDGKKEAEWQIAGWLERDLFGSLQRTWGEKAGEGGPRKFELDGKTYLFALRPQRFYKPFSLSLVDFKFDRYLGTGIAKNYSADVILERPDTGEKREIHIKMNSPLRYGGETFYQGSFTKDERATILQVVRNPSWLTPYVACVMVGAGLMVQFLGHLIGFARRRSA